MPLPVHPSAVQFVCNGTLLGGEIWTNRFYIASDDGSTPAQGTIESWANRLREFYLRLASQLANEWALTHIVATPLTGPGIAPIHINVVDVVGTKTDSPLPYQCSLVQTLIAFNSPFTPRYGRQYLAGFTVGSVTTTGRVLQTTVNAVRDSCVQLGADLDLVLPGVNSGYLALVSKQGNSTLLFRANEVRVGDIWDTQRRRRNALIEAYTLGALPAG